MIKIDVFSYFIWFISQSYEENIDYAEKSGQKYLTKFKEDKDSENSREGGIHKKEPTNFL